MTTVTGADIERALNHLGLGGQSVVAHASLKSFGWVEGGATAVVAALTSVSRDVLMPAFNWGEGSALVAPPKGLALDGNGIDEGFMRSLPPTPQPFDPERTPIHPAMGAVPRALWALAGTRRSTHPLASWLAHGPLAAALTEDQPWADPYLPLRRLAERSAFVLLCGVGLRACTALHLAEERAGRRSFVRWVLRSDGSTAEVRVGGCSDGFDRLWPALRDVFRRERAGNAELFAAPLARLLERASDVFSKQPELSRCSASCVRCRDALAG